MRQLGVFGLLAMMLIAGCLDRDPDGVASFTLLAEPPLLGSAVPDQMLVFLVTVESDSADPVRLTGDAEGAAVTVEPSTIAPGELAEVAVRVPESAANSTWTLALRGERAGTKADLDVLINVEPSAGEPPREKAIEVRDRFVAWLAEEHPDLGIDASTSWEDTTARPIWLVVSYHTFYTDEWEMGVRWHIMVPPYDWAEIYLRERYEEVSPGLGWKIDSLNETAQEPYAVQPEPDVWR